jgi:hypothetical protein
MATWAEVEAAVPDLARSVRGRFEATGLAFLATLRRDGSPRISGQETLFTGQLWLGMMTDSRKGDDLRRDPRFALHAASDDKEVSAGDAKLGGRAVEVASDDEIDAFRADWAAHRGSPAPDGPMLLFRADIESVSFLRPAGDHLLIEWWTEAGGYSRTDRY